MNKEMDRMIKILSGMELCNFSGLSPSTENRKGFEFTWTDLSFNINDAPFFMDTAVIVTSHSGHLIWLKSTLASYRLTGAYVILSYDPSSIFPWHNLEDPTYGPLHLPRPIHYLLAHSVVMKHKTYDAEKRIGWFWNARYAYSIIKSFPNIKYVYCTNGDCIFDKPEGLKQLSGILGDGDFMSGQSTPGSTIHTACLYAKIEVFEKIMDYFTSRMKNTVLGGQSPECILGDAVKILGLKETFVKYPILADGSVDYYGTQNLPCTWKDVLGFRNLYHENEYRENNRLEPIEKKYFDSFMNYIHAPGPWQETLCQYFATGDRRYLMMWWDRGCDTDTDRRYYDLDHYGKEPILDGGN